MLRMLPKGLKDKVAVSLLRRSKIPRTIGSERERNLTFSGSRKGDSKTLQLSSMVLVKGLGRSCERVDYCEGLLRDKRIDVERTCVVQ